MPKPSLPRIGRPPRWLIVACVVLLAAAWLITSNRWSIGRRAVEIVDPSVRAWATREVSRLSEGAYLLTASTIQVDEAKRRVAIDTITVTTDTVANARRKAPLPHLALRFTRCALEGIDLDQLTGGAGLHVARVGCDSVGVMVDVPAAVGARMQQAAPGPGGGGFLNLRERLDLPRSIPLIAIDTIAFPQLGLVLSIEAATGRRTNFSLDRLGVQFDSLHYQRRGEPDDDRVLLSRDVRVVLERFEGSREASSHLALKLLSASLSRRTLRLDSLHYKPLPGRFADSLGLTELQVGHLGMEGIDWRGFLTTGDIQVARLVLDTAVVRLPHRVGVQASAVTDGRGPTLEATLRSLDRRIHLDSLAARHLVFIRDGASPRDSSATSVAHLQITDLGFDNDSATWAGAFPAGRLRLAADSVAHRGGGERFTADSIRIDAATGTIVAAGVRKGPEGDDEAFFRRLKYRRDRQSLAVRRVELLGVDFPTFLRKGDQRVRRASFEGFAFDVLSDKRKPASPAGPPRRRTPQDALRGQGLSLAADTITVQGSFTYRERGAEAPAAGVLEFRDLRATITGLRAEQGVLPDSVVPLHVVADAKLMGRGAFHFDLVLPPQATTFQMRYRGTLGPMPADALNGFLGDAVGMRFTAGTLEGIRFEATVDRGHALGTIAPRWNGLRVDLPGVGRGSGFLGGIKRAVAKFAANQFVIRGDNSGTVAADPKKPVAPLDGVIDYRWDPTETLPKFLWNSLRDPLLKILKN